MNVLDFINNSGQKEISNPNYNPKSKKNTEPATIIVPDLDPSVPRAIEMTREELESGYSVAASITDKYRKHGINYNPWEDLDKQLADRQSGWTKLGNAIAQTVVSELALGTVKGISDLVDFVGSIIGLSDGDYSNPVSQTLEKWQEQFRDYAAIHVNPNVNIGNGGLTDVGWWASNLPSVISSLTLLIPSTGVVKGVSAVGKAANVGSHTRNTVRAITGANNRLKKAARLKAEGATAAEIAKAGKLNSVQRFLTSRSTAKQTALFLENGTTAALSRAMENYQEARQTYNDMYADASEYFQDDEIFNQFVDSNKDKLKQAGIDTTNKDEVAKYIATSSADRTFQLDWLNVVFDTFQMYGLRNAWKGMKNAEGTPTKVRRANKDVAKYVGKSRDEIKAIKAGRKFREKAGEWLEDRAYGSKFIIGAQLSEGVEEAVNYIASQEGIHFGNVLLGKEIGENKGVWENIFNGFDGRLSQYMQAPELWDSAFWGTMGGIMFQQAGSGFRRLSNRIAEGKSEANKESQEKLPWYSLGELPENKRRIADIYARNEDFGQFNVKLKDINDGKDIYNSTESNTVMFSSEEEQQAAREKLIDEYIAKMTLRSVNSGNYDLLRAYLSDENLRKGFIESGIFANSKENKTQAEIEQESKEFIDRAINRMDEIANMYDEEIRNIDYASSQIASDTKKRTGSRQEVLAEYMQIMAFNNVTTRLAITGLQKDLAAANSRIGTLLSDENISGKLDRNIDHENNIKVAVLTNELGKLYAQRKRILNDENKSISNEISIKEIDKQIESIEQELDDAQLVLATHEALRYTLSDDGKSYTQNDTLESVKYKDSMITNRGEVAVGSILFNDDALLSRLSKRAKSTMSEETFGKFDVLKQDFNTTLSRFNVARNAIEQTETGIVELDNLYQRKATVTQSIKNLQNSIVKTTSEIRDAAGVLHNTMNEARIGAIKQAEDIIIDLYGKYGINVRNSIVSLYNGDKEASQSYLSNLKDAERKSLSDALEILDITKSHNQSLAYALDDSFRLYDIAKAAQESQTETVESESNATNSNAISDNNSVSMENPSTNPLQAGTNEQGGQNEASNEYIDPQKTDNRQPAFYTEFYTDKGKFTSRKHDNRDNGRIAVYDNGDGTFTLDVRGNIKKLKDTRFFGNTNQVDVTRPFEVVSKPIARRNAKGKLEIIQTGELVNTDTIEYQERQRALAEQNQQTIEQGTTSNPQSGTEPTNQTLPEPTVITDPQPTTSESIGQSSQTGEPINTTMPSTGELMPPSQPAPSNVEAEIFIEESTLDDTIRMESLGKLQKAYRANHEVNLDELSDKIIDEYVKQGHSREVVEAAVNKSKGILKRIIERKANNANRTMQSSVDEVLVETSLLESIIVEEDEVNPFVQSYKDAIKNMIEQYAKEFGIEKLNGIYYINLEDLLRYVNTIENDSTTAGVIFNSLKSYLSTKEAKSNFIVTDGNETNKSDFLNNVAKPVEQRYLERINEEVQRIDVNGLLNSLSTKEEKDELIERLENVKPGDKLQYTIDNGRITIRNSEGKPLGVMPIPKIDKKTGAYRMVNDGWVTDVLASNNGEIISKLKDRFLRWFDPTNDAAKDLNAIIYELSYAKPSKERKAELLEKFKNNPEIKLAKAEGFTSANATNEQLINSLVKLWRFRDYHSATVNGTQNRNVRLSLNEWFKKLNESYNSVIAIANGQIQDIIVDSISGEQLIRISDKNIEQTAIPANKAIAGGPNPEIHKIAYGMNGSLIASGIPTISFSSVSTNNTFVLIPNKLGNYGYVRAVPAEITDDFIGDEAKEIINEFKNHITKLLDIYRSNVNEENFNNIKDFFINALYSPNNKLSLFFNITAYDQGNTLVLHYKNGGQKITIQNGSNNIHVTNPEFKVNQKGYQEKSIPLSSPEASRYMNELINNLRFNINHIYIKSDNDRNLSIEGLAKRDKNGKFIITIGDKTWTYNSYNEFMLKNNLLRLNTKPNEKGTSNYSRMTDDSQYANQTFKIKFNTITSSPVESNKQVQTTQPTTQPIIQQNNEIINEQAEKILNSNDESINKPLELVKLVFGEETLKSFINLGILPRNIIFDVDFNNKKGYENYNGQYDIKTGNITVGQKWLDMFKNPNKRKEAIRKLIHEKLHSILHEDGGKNKGYINSAKEIYEEFKEYLDKNNVPANAHIRQYLFSNYSPEVALEEFLVESLTSKELANYLNGIDAKVTKKGGRKNLLQKILELMSKVFGWDVRKGSLYEKELYTLRNTFNKPSNPKSIKKTTTTNNMQLELNFDTQFEIKPSIETTTQETVDTTEQVPTNETTKEPESKVAEQTKSESVTEADENSPYGEDFSDDLMDEFRLSSVTEQTTDYTDEMNEIKQQAISNDTFMKAPNGNPTNLNERQWLQVRTKNFINWFGDWINNPEEASKVVDENGEPKIMYHGTNAEFTIFNTKIDPILGQTFGQGSYFTSTNTTGTYFGNKVMNVFLNIKNPAYIDSDNFIIDKNDQKEVPVYLHSIGRDGVFVQEHGQNYIREYVVFNPNQIKSATSNTGEFSTTNDDIRYSSITEMASDIPSVQSFQERLPVDQQAKFASLVESAIIQSSCR